MKGYAKQVRRLLAAAGWEFLRQGAGDHEVWWNPSTRQKVVVDVGMKSKHTANGVLKQAGLPKAF